MTLKLDDIIKYFKSELELINLEFKNDTEERRFALNANLLIFSIAAVIFSALISSLMKPEIISVAPRSFHVISILIILFIIVLIGLFFHFVYMEYKEKRRKSSRSLGLEIILNFLYHLKVIQVKQKDILPLVKRIRYDYMDNRLTSISNNKEFDLFHKKRIKEFTRICDQINNKVNEKEEE